MIVAYFASLRQLLGINQIIIIYVKMQNGIGYD